MSDTVLSFYDHLASDYHLIFANWDEAVIRQGQELRAILESLHAGKKLLDCSCGIGTQAIGLAKQGYQVYATDLSPMSVQRAKQEATRLEVEIDFNVADMRELESVIMDKFDVIISCDNSVPHLLNDADLEQAAASLYNRLHDGGILLISIRDYDEILEAKPQTTPIRVLENRLTFQLWEWNEDIYTVHHFILTEDNLAQWQTRHNVREDAALGRADLTRFIEQAGCKDVQWHLSGYYQPVLTARKI